MELLLDIAQKKFSHKFITSQRTKVGSPTGQRQITSKKSIQHLSNGAEINFIFHASSAACTSNPALVHKKMPFTHAGTYKDL